MTALGEGIAEEGGGANPYFRRLFFLRIYSDGCQWQEKIGMHTESTFGTESGVAPRLVAFERLRLDPDQRFPRG